MARAHLLVVALVANMYGCASIPAQLGPVGSYRTVTESEYDVVLNLAADGNATYLHTYWKAGESDNEQKDSHSASWEMKDSLVAVTFPGGGFIEYRIDPCLSYEWFGSAGCSFGLEPVAARSEHFAGLRFWRAQQFQK